MTDFAFGMRDAQKAALAGQDLEMPFQNLFHRHLKELVESGRVPLDVLNDSTMRKLRSQIRFAESEFCDPGRLGCEAHRMLAREAAEKSIVLLQNKNLVLPLQPVGRIAVVGRLADLANTGDGGSSNTRPDYVVTPLDGIRAALTSGAQLLYESGDDLELAAAAARGADAVVLVVGNTSKDEGEFIPPEAMRDFLPIFPEPPAGDEFAHQFGSGGRKQHVGAFKAGGDRTHLTLRPRDEALIRAMSAANRNTVVVVMGGSAIIMESWRRAAGAILMLWYPDMEGGHALANVLFGRAVPSGKLPFVIPRNVAGLPCFQLDAREIEYDLWHGYRKLEREGIEPAFPFGFGLSYTSYTYTNLKMATDRLAPSGVLALSLEVCNTGARAGEEIVQLYVSPIGSTVARAPKELKAFTRIRLNPGQTRQVAFELPMARLANYDQTGGRFVVESIDYELLVARHSLDRQGLKARFAARND